MKTLSQRRFGAGAFGLAWMLVLAGLLWPAIGNAQTSQCPVPLTATIPTGGSHVFDVSQCTPDIGGFGLSSGPPAVDPENGSIVLSPVNGRQQSVTYVHDGGQSNSDAFSLWDEVEDAFVQFQITVTAPNASIVVAPATLPTLTAGTPFNQSLSASGGATPYTYTLQGGALPVGVSLSAGGVLSGTPTQRGAYSFVVRVQDALGASVDKGYAGTVQNPSLTLAPATATAVQGSAFSATLTAAGGVAPYAYQLESGTLPAGITLSGAGLLSGTTTAAPGNYPLSIRVTDASTGPGSYFEVENFTLTVSPPPSVSIAVSPASVSEDGSTNLTYTVTRSLNLSSPTVVNITTSGTATPGTDYTGNVPTVTIPAGATTASIVIDPIADTVVEPNETVILTVAPGSGYTVGTPSSATGNILNDDVPTATISVSPASVSEDGAANLVYTVALDQATPSALSINFTVGGTATSGTDYVAVSSPLAIAAGATSGTIIIDPIADSTIEANETVVITLVAGGNYAVGTPSSATGTILNDDLPSLSINDVTASEGNSGTTNFTFTVSLNAPAGPGGVSFDIATANGTATAGSDYVASSLTGQTIPAGSSTYTFTVQVNGDTLNEPDETFFVNVTNVTNAVTVDGQGVGTIVNDDPLPALSINDVTVTEGNAGTTSAVFTVTLSAASGRTVAVNYATADGTATAPVDYVSTSGTLTFPPGVTTRTVTVLVNGDTTPEANETFSVNLSGASNATIADAQGIGTIVNDDVPVTVDPASLPGGTVATAYSQTLSASGGAAPYTFAVTAGALPAGLGLTPAGVLSGTPTAGGSFVFTVTATDSSAAPGPYTGSRSYTLTIAAATVTLPATSLPDGTLGSSYSAAIAPATGGTAPYAYAVTAGALPNGLTLAPATGTISGTPTALGTFNFAVTATDSSTGTGPYSSAPRGYSLRVVDVAPVANAVSITVAYNAATTPVPLDITGGAPTAVAVAAAPAHGTAVATGTTITYQPVAGFAGSDSFTYTASNSGGSSAPASVTVTVSDPAITISAGNGLSAAVGDPYTQTFTWNGGAPPWTGYQVTNLPAGLAITGTGANSVTVSGTPTQAGSFVLSVSATDSSTGNGPFTVAQTFTLSVAGPTLALAPGPSTFNAPYAAPFSQVFTASGGTGPYSYAYVGAAVPGLAFTASTLSGAPTAPGTYTFEIVATDTGTTGTGAPYSISQPYTLVVASPTIAIAPATLPDPVAGAAYSQTLSAGGGVAPYTFAVTAGALPAGLGLSPAGALTGTPTEVGTFSVTVTATDANGQSGSRGYTLTIATPTLALSPAAGTLVLSYGAAYTQVFSASGSPGPYTYVLMGALPPGIGFSGDTLSGTPTAPGSYPVTVTATDAKITSGGQPLSISQAYTLDVPAPSIAITPATLPGATIGAAFSQTLAAGGGVAPYAFSLTGGALPAGVTLTGDGTLAGTPTAAGTFNLSITATDAFGQSAVQAYAWVVAAPVLTLDPTAGTLAAPYATPFSQTFSAGGGVGPYTYAIAGALPAGVAFSGNTLAGTPTVPGSYAIVVTATDTGASGAGAPFSISQSYTLEVPAPAIAIAPATLPGATAGTAYAQTLTATGGAGPYVFSVGGGALPAGLALSSGGSLAGTPTAAGTFNVVIAATDANGQSATRAYALVVAVPSVTLSPDTLPGAAAGTPYSLQFSASGGVPGYRYAVTAGALPAGLSLDAGTGLLSGTPTVAGTFNVSVTVTDSTTGTPGTATVPYTLIVASPVIVVDPDVLPQAVTSLDYTQALVARGGTAPYVFTVASGALPAGLSLSSTGVLSGAPSGSGSFAVTVRATDALGFSGTRAYTLAVIERPDPTRDAEVRGLLDAQAAATRRFATSQLDNFQQRLEQLHSGHAAATGSRNGLAFATRERCPDNRFHAPDGICGSATREREAERFRGPYDDGGASGTGDASQAPDSDTSTGGVGYWIGGTLRSGNFDGQSGSQGFEFETEGVSAGADIRVHPSLVLGAGLGYGQDSTTVGRNGSHLRGRARTLALYASLQPGGTFFVDGVIGYQSLSYDLDRFVTATGAIARGARDGDQRLASISIGTDLARGQWQHTPYARIDAMRGTLDGYTEQGGGVHALAYGEQDVDTTTGNIGLRSSFRHVTTWGAFAPQFRIEYQHDFDADGTASMRYADLLGPGYVTGVRGFDRSRLMLGIGAAFQFTGYSLQLDYRGVVGSGEQRDNGVQLMFRTGR